MRISQKLEYACRAVVCLAKHYDGSSVVKVEDIAVEEAIPASFLVQILNELKRAELVQSKRGKAGGYSLHRPPSAISLADLVHALEPGLVEPPPEPHGQSGASVQAAWAKISKSLNSDLRELTFDTLAAPNESPMYFI